MKKIYAAIMMLLAVSGCAATGTTYQDYVGTMDHAGGNKARLYVFRTHEHSQYSGRSASVKIDGTSVGSCDYAGFVPIDTDTGKHILSVDMWDSPGHCDLTVEAVSGQTYYFEVKPRTGNLISGMFGGLVGMGAESAGKQCGGAFSVEAVEKNNALAKLKELRLSK